MNNKRTQSRAAVRLSRDGNICITRGTQVVAITPREMEHFMTLFPDLVSKAKARLDELKPIEAPAEEGEAA